MTPKAAFSPGHHQETRAELANRQAEPKAKNILSDSQITLWNALHYLQKNAGLKNVA